MSWFNKNDGSAEVPIPAKQPIPPNQKPQMEMHRTSTNPIVTYEPFAPHVNQAERRKKRNKMRLERCHEVFRQLKEEGKEHTPRGVAFQKEILRRENTRY